MPTKRRSRNALRGHAAARGDDANLGVLVLATVPLLLLATWVFFALGRSYPTELSDAELPGIAGRVGPWVAVFGALAVLALLTVLGWRLKQTQR